MKFAAVLAFVAAATVVSAATNAERFARGLGPNAPVKRATPVARGRKSTPSGVSQCSSGSVQCCNTVEKAHSGGIADNYMDFYGILGSVAADVPIGVGCSAITGIGAASGGACGSQAVCCDNNKFNGVIAIGCSPVNLNL